MRAFIAILLLALPAIAADEPVTIKLKLHPAPGQMILSDSRHTDTGTTRIEDADGKLLVEVKPGGSETIERTTILEADSEGTPTKYLRTFDKANETESGKKKTFSYEGRTILYEKQKDGKFRVGVVGKDDLDPADAEKLVDKANRPSESDALMKQFAPKKPVKVGDSWPLDAKLMATAMESKVEEAKSSVTVKLLKVSTRGKTLIGTFELDAKLAVTAMTGKVEMTFEPAIVLTMKGTMELVIDGSSTENTGDIEMGMKGAGTWKNAGGASGKISFDVSGKVKEVEGAEQVAKATKAPAVTWLRQPGEWAAFKPKDGSFTVDFPGAAKEESKKGPNGDTTVTWTASAEGGAVAYVVGTTDFAGADPARLNAKAVLNAVANNQKGAKNLKDVKINDYPGIEFDREELVAGKTLEFRQRVVMANGRMYQQIVIAEKGKGKQADSDKFFASYKVLAKPVPKDD
ncbi:MAG TPA: hypothetical protein VHR66_27110 [Gemmataceae bacterium]|jgi:hypothetical protein|nr:hypothetical protein [Gemmataceae bacterium]